MKDFKRAESVGGTVNGNSALVKVHEGERAITKNFVNAADRLLKTVYCLYNAVLNLP